MKLNEPLFWKSKNFVSILLLPISIFFQIVIKIFNNFVNKKFFEQPIICVGNIYVGGTGKTPLVIKIYDELYKHKAAVIKKFYNSHQDEINLTKHYVNNFFINKSRVDAINEAIKKKSKLIILDDGMQDPNINADINIICFKTSKLIGNGFTLPSGPLREPLNSVKKCNFVVINGKKDKKFENRLLQIHPYIKIYYSKYLPVNHKNLRGKKVLAFCGIGNSDDFYDILEKNKVKILKRYSFPDHYDFKDGDLKKIKFEAKKEKLMIITTEKDYFRIKNKDKKNIKFLKIKLLIENEKRFFEEIKKFL